MVFSFKARKQRKLIDLVDQLSSPGAKASVLSQWVKKSLDGFPGEDVKSKKLLTPESREYVAQLAKDHFTEISPGCRENFSYLLEDPLIYIRTCSDKNEFWRLNSVEERIKKPEEWEALFVAYLDSGHGRSNTYAYELLQKDKLPLEKAALLAEEYGHLRFAAELLKGRFPEKAKDLYARLSAQQEAEGMTVLTSDPVPSTCKMFVEDLEELVASGRFPHVEVSDSHESGISLDLRVLSPEKESYVKFMEEAVELAREAGDEERVTGLHQNLMGVLRHQGDFFGAGVYAEKLGQTEQAISYFEKAESHYRAGNLCSQMKGMEEQAIENFSKAGDHVSCGHIYRRLGKVDEAIAAYQKDIGHALEYIISTCKESDQLERAQGIVGELISDALDSEREEDQGTLGLAAHAHGAQGIVGGLISDALDSERKESKISLLNLAAYAHGVELYSQAMDIYEMKGRLPSAQQSAISAKNEEKEQLYTKLLTFLKI